MDYEFCEKFLYNQLPMFQKEGKKALKYDLSTIKTLCKYLDNPERKFKSIHIAGTNGKGSVSHQIASVLISAGYKVGLYTSPHLVSFRERIKINGMPIEKAFVVEFIEKDFNFWNEIKPTFFELTTLLAFSYFANKNVDYAVIETGLGGRLDATNVVIPILSVITNVSYDHIDILGNTLEKIAFEKAGIIKKNIPVVVGESDKETMPVFIQKAKDENSPIIFADQKYKCYFKEALETLVRFEIYNEHTQTYEFKGESDLLGFYQKKNIVTSYCTLQFLKNIGLKIRDEQLKKGFKNVKRNTGFIGRWQIIQNKPLIICDTAHNEAGMNYVIDQLTSYHYANLHLILAFSADKDVHKILLLFKNKLSGKNIKYYFTQSSVIRALLAEELFSKALKMGLEGVMYNNIKEAFENVKKKAGKNDIIFIGGSIFIVGDFMKEFI